MKEILYLIEVNIVEAKSEVTKYRIKNVMTNLRRIKNKKIKVLNK